jgi:hypothetical protein
MTSIEHTPYIVFPQQGNVALEKYTIDMKIFNCFSLTERDFLSLLSSGNIPGFICS